MSLLRKNSLFLIFSILIISCNKYDDYFYSINEKPIVSINKYGDTVNSNFISDTIKINNDSLQNLYKFGINISDFGDQIILENFKISLNSHNQKSLIFGYFTFYSLESNSDTLSQIFTLYDNNYGYLAINSFKTGIYNYKLIYTDNYNLSDTAYINLYCFDNLGPECNFNAIHLGDGQIRVDASGSYDADQKWGGSIEQYEFTVNDEKRIISSPIFNTTVEGINFAIVKVRVKDNDDVWSSQESEIIYI